MFNNTGRTIKLYSKIMFWVMTVSLVLTGIVFLSESFDFWEYLVSFLVIILGPIMAWFSASFIYGYGELVEKVGNLEKHIVNTTEIMYNKSKVESFVDNINDRVADAARVLTKPNPEKTVSFTTQLGISAGGSRCPQCGTLLEPDAAYCTKCGAPVFAKTEEPRICPSCGKPVSTESAFCTKCGHQM